MVFSFFFDKKETKKDCFVFRKKSISSLFRKTLGYFLNFRDTQIIKSNIKNIFKKIIMKTTISLFILLLCLLTSCSSDSDTQISDLREGILSNQKEIRFISNEIVGFDLEGLDYANTIMASKIGEFTNKREEQKSKIVTLETEYNETIDMETLVCGDFEEINCFVENWEVRKTENAIVKISEDQSYNRTSSLYLSAPFDPDLFNVPGVEIEGYINGIEAATIYKIRFWAKYNGTSDQSNGPLVYMTAIQDGEWLDYLYEGFGHLPNEYVDKDWKIYSFQIATLTDSPLEIIFGTNMENVYLDDIHIIKKEE